MTQTDRSLPDVAPLEAMDTQAVRGLRERLSAIGLAAPRLEPVARSAAEVHPLLARPVLHYRLRKQKDPFAYAARALVFGDPISKEELNTAFAEFAAPIVSAGLVVEGERGFVSPFCLAVVDDIYVFSDDLSYGGDAVMGLGPGTTALSSASVPRKRVGSALDLGCGAGAVGLALSRKADKVVFTDINPRALTMTRFNARLNKITNVDIRQGSLFEPVAGERFDIIASQPPFIPQAEGVKAGEFMTGGSRGDELPLALLEALPPHLAPNGRAILSIEWGLGPQTDPPVKRVVGAIGQASVDVLIFQLPPSSCDAHASEYAAALHPRLGPDYENEAHARREHCTKMGIEIMVPTLCVLTQVDGRPPRVDVLPTGSFGRIRPNSKRIDKLVAARSIVSSIDSLLGAKLRMVDKVTLREEQVGPGVHVESTLAAIMPPHAMTEPAKLTPLLLRLTTCVHEAASVRAGIEAYGARYKSEERPEQLAATVASALLSGLLEVADGP